MAEFPCYEKFSFDAEAIVFNANLGLCPKRFMNHFWRGSE